MPGENENLKQSALIKIYGNTDAKILAKAFEEYSKGGLTQNEREKIERIDDVLKGADKGTRFIFTFLD